MRWMLALLVSGAFAATTEAPTAPAPLEPKAGQVLFSPNGDGVLDAAVFNLAVSEPQNVTEWDFHITDTLAKDIKRFSGKGAPPKSLDWNGKDENNQLIRDGTYQYSLSIVTLAGAKVSMPPQELICDRQAPNAQASVEPAIFSPEEGSAKPTATFFLQAFDASGYNSWLLRVKTANAVKSFFGKGGPPEKVVWDGKTDGGDPAPTGEYQFTLAVRDRAGNTTTTAGQPVRIDRAEPVTQVEAKPAIFSPNADAVHDVTAFQVTPPPIRKQIESWSLLVKDLRGKTVKSFEGAGDPPRELVWDGTGTDGKLLPDGTYSYSLPTLDQAGNRGMTMPKTLVIDTKPPQASSEFKPALLSPNGDGFGDSGAFANAAQDENGIESYALEIRNDVGDLKRSFKAEGSPAAQIQWAGQDESAANMPDGKYTYHLTVTDRAGNKTQTLPRTAQIDVNPPVVEFSVEPTLISPHGDQKEARFTVGEQDASEVEAWSLKITDAQNKLVRLYQGTGALNGQLAWDGQSDAKQLVPDGPYSCVFWTQDKAHNSVTLSPKTVTVGARIPDVTAQASAADFSPNADGVLDAVTFALGVKAFNKARSWALEITDQSGIRVRDFSGLGAPPKEVQWGGERDDKSRATDGHYRYQFRTVDEAGNKNQSAVSQIQIDTTRPEASARAVPVLFSPNGDGTIDATAFQLTYKDESPAGKWTISVKNESGRVVREFKGTGALPPSVPWDGKGEGGGKAVPDGSYTFTLVAEDSVGNKSVTLDEIVRVDDTPPELTLKGEPAIFAPKSETGRSRASFATTAQDASNVARWVLKIKGPRGDIAEEIKGDGRPPADIAWEGLDAKGAAFPDGPYEAKLHAIDEVGNEGISAPSVVTINTAKPVLLVAAQEESVPSLMPELKTQDSDRGIVIPLAAEVLFETGKNEVKPDAFSTLDEAAAIVRRYTGRHVSVEGHTDNVPISNPDFKNNQELSQGRAEAVRGYFVKVKGLDGSRLSAKGWGDTKPIGDNATPDGRKKNRRVEIIIEKAAPKAAPKAPAAAAKGGKGGR